jgi:hypothetical protein
MCGSRQPLVTSAIINVAQDVDEDWILEVRRSHLQTSSGHAYACQCVHACLFGHAVPYAPCPRATTAIVAAKCVEAIPCLLEQNKTYLLPEQLR